MAFRDTLEDRVESPDSGIEMSSFDFDIEGCSALLSGNDPILNNVNAEPFAAATNTVLVDEESPVIETAEMMLPVVESTIIQPDTDTIIYMDSDDEPETPAAPVDTNTDTIHSYSTVSVQKPKTIKCKRPASFNKTKQMTLKSQGKKLSINIRRKKKLYEMSSLADPVAEKNRLNAINAKKNRDRKKQQLQEAEVEIEKLREENDELRAETDNYKDQLEQARRELQMLKQMYKATNGSLPAHLGNKVTPC